MQMATTEVPREKLKELVEKNGESLLQDRDRCEGLLKDYCAGHRREISAIVGAMEERVPLELKSSWQTAMTPEAMRARLVQRLEENRGLAPEIANYAVETWSYALGVNLGRSSDRVQDVVPVPPAPLTPEQRAAADQAGGVVPPIVPVNNTGKLSNQNKAIVGGVGLLAAAAVAFALLHHPAPTPPDVKPPGQSQNPASGGNGGTSGGNSGTNGGNASNTDNQNPTDNGKKVAGNDTANHGTSGNTGGGSGGTGGSTSDGSSVKTAAAMPVGTSVVVRLDSDFNSDNANVGDMLPATVVTPLTSDGNVVVQRGAGAQVKVVSIDKSGKLAGKSHVQFALVGLTAHGKLVHVTSSSKSVDGPSQGTRTAERTGIGGAAGAAIGALAGHLFHHAGTGAAVGAGAGGATGALTSKPAPVKVSAETVMQFRLTKGLALGS
jgi:hypothetical protein